LLGSGTGKAKGGDTAEMLATAYSGKVDRLHRLWEETAEGQALKSPARSEKTFAAPKHFSKSSFCHEFTLLFGRGFRNMLRNKMLGRVRIGTALIMGLIIGAIYAGMGNDQGSIQSR
jgi:hypothetical protein